MILLGSLFAAGMVLSGDVSVLGSLVGSIIHFATSPWRVLKKIVSARPRWRKKRPAPLEDDPDPSNADPPNQGEPDAEGNSDQSEEDDGDENPVPISIPINAPPRLIREEEDLSEKQPVCREGKTTVRRASVRRDELDPSDPPEKQQPSRTARLLAARRKKAEVVEPEPIEEPEEQLTPIRREPIKVNSPLSMRDTENQLEDEGDEFEDERLDTDFALPPIDILEPAEDFPYELLAKKAQADAAVLEKTFKEFGLNVQVVEVDTGPVVTQFELGLEAGLRLNKITALADDLAIALRVPSVRVVAPIPGKNTVGIEVPNEKRTMVRLRELIESSSKERNAKRIPIFVGKDVSGHPMTVDLTKMPHLLIAGRTGTGKSVCLNTLILSILMTRSPDEVKMLMIDP
ncbi:MAG: DNA translocase FtsK, partial [Planctomycetaceae bacterium]|nr:DNA translocase FtsK [Planctomycetaceae bacterium]